MPLMTHNVGGRCSKARTHLLAALLCVAAAATAHAQCGGFSVAQSSGASIVPGVTDRGNHCDDCTTPFTLPFPVSLYGATYTSALLCSNGSIQFTGDNADYTNQCLPSVLGVTIAPHWDDLRTDSPGDGIFTSVSGLAPNRVLNIEWRTTYYSGSGDADFELRLFEDNTHFEAIYGGLAEGGASATIGAQHTALPPTQFSCNTGGLLNPGSKLTFTCYNGPTGAGAATPSSVYACGTQGVTLLTVNVFPGSNPPSTGITVNANLSSIGGSASQTFYNDGTHGDATASDTTYSYQHTVPEATTPGAKALAYTIADAQGRSTQGVIGLQVDPCPSSGPDVWVAHLTDVAYYGTLNGINAYAIGTDACNRGDVPVSWFAGSNQHPVIAQNMYRLMNGRFEQIGQSWLKHGFASTNSDACATCQQPPAGGQQLGVHCSDAYGAGLNGGQGGLGPRSEVNSTTGVYVWPFYTGDISTLIGVRLQVKTTDVTPALNPGAQYFGECHYITADDAQWSNAGAPAENGLNNVTYQALSNVGADTTPNLAGLVQPMAPALSAWQAADPSVTLVSADYIDTSLVPAGIKARYWVGAKATDNGNGTWHYEYAVFNLNSDRAGGSFAVPVAPGTSVTNIGFHGIFAHSGEPYPNTAINADNWSGAVSNGQVRWNCPEAYVAPGNNANALRWGTLYNFRFDANIAPGSGAAAIGLFKPGSPASVTAPGVPVPVPQCDAIDFNGDSLFPDTQDITDFIAVFGGAQCPTGTCGDIDFNNDGLFPDTDDISALVRVFGGGGCI